MSYHVRPIIPGTRRLLDSEGLGTNIIVGSIRHMTDVDADLESAAHIVTMPPPILRKMLWNPRTDENIREFNTAWAITSKIAVTRGGEGRFTSSTVPMDRTR